MANVLTYSRKFCLTYSTLRFGDDETDRCQAREQHRSLASLAAIAGPRSRSIGSSGPGSSPQSSACCARVQYQLWCRSKREGTINSTRMHPISGGSYADPFLD